MKIIFDQKLPKSKLLFNIQSMEVLFISFEDLVILVWEKIWVPPTPTPSPGKLRGHKEKSLYLVMNGRVEATNEGSPMMGVDGPPTLCLRMLLQHK